MEQILINQACEWLVFHSEALVLKLLRFRFESLASNLVRVNPDCGLTILGLLSVLLGHHDHWLVMLGHVGAQNETLHEFLAHRTGFDLVVGYREHECD